MDSNADRYRITIEIPKVKIKITKGCTLSAINSEKSPLINNHQKENKKFFRFNRPINVTISKENSTDKTGIIKFVKSYMTRYTVITIIEIK